MRIPVAARSTDSGAEWTLAASLFLPPERVAGQSADEDVPLLVLLPGGGYSRRYFDLPVEGFSQAAHHASRGAVVLTLDHLGVGESTVPATELTTLEAVAATIDTAVRTVRADLGLRTGPVVGAGQSMGGHVAVAVQALHHRFDAVALLGSSVAGTRFPSRPGTPPLVVPDGATELEAALMAHDSIDWNWAFHYDPDSVGAIDPTTQPHDLQTLVACDIAAGLPAKQVAVPWASLTYPGFVSEPRYAERVARLAGDIDVPVLLASGERDVTQPLDQERARFTQATAVTTATIERMAHMHNFSDNRGAMWDALDSFVASL